MKNILGFWWDEVTWKRKIERESINDSWRTYSILSCIFGVRRSCRKINCSHWKFRLLYIIYPLFVLTPPCLHLYYIYSLSKCSIDRECHLPLVIRFLILWWQKRAVSCSIYSYVMAACLTPYFSWAQYNFVQLFFQWIFGFLEFIFSFYSILLLSLRCCRHHRVSQSCIIEIMS